MNSILNPEAPEFYPHITSVTEDGYQKVTKTIRSANILPFGTSLEIFKTYQDFNIVSRQITKNLIFQSNEIIKKEIADLKLIIRDNEYNTEKVIDMNDRILDRINLNIDYVSRGEEKPPEPTWTRPVITKIQLGPNMFFGAKNISRPQLYFKDGVDNSDNLWVPKIFDKPNNIKPLALNIIYSDEGEAVGYEHPYKVELDLYEPPPDFLEPDSEPPVFPPAPADTPLSFIETEAELDQLVTHLTKVTEIAVDVEHHSYRTYQGITCLIQISTCDGDFIIDTLAVREHVHKLNLVFTDPKKIKVFHGAERDVVWLQRDFGVYVVGMLDTHQAARALSLHGLSLKSLLLRYCRVEADKRFQLADWRIRPLPDELREYARSDTHYLLYVWRRMKADLLDMAPDGGVLRAVFENSRHVCLITYNKYVLDDKSHIKMYVRSKKFFNTRQMAALRLLFKWRDSQARELDESTTYLLPNHMLMALAEILPPDIQAMNAMCNPMPPFLKQNLVTLHRMILSCRELPLYATPYTAASTVVPYVPPPKQMHDLAYLNCRGEEPQYPETKVPNVDPEVPAFKTPPPPPEKPKGSVLNVNAKMFIPPYDRYKKYRVLVQGQEIQEYNEREAKIAAISNGNELINSEVLVKLQEAKLVIVNEAKEDAKAKAKTKKKIEAPKSRSVAWLDEGCVSRSMRRSEGRSFGRSESPQPHGSAQRKKKMSHAEKAEKKREIEKEKNNAKQKNKNHKSKNKKESKVKNKKEQTSVKPYNYKKVNYKKFQEEVDKTDKQPKTKCKKHK